jgi:hypothetical protein
MGSKILRFMAGTAAVEGGTGYVRKATGGVIWSTKRWFHKKVLVKDGEGHKGWLP